MTLPTTTLNATDDDSDMFGPPRTSPLRHTRPRIPMISPKIRLHEERKRILLLCSRKLERIKDSETNLRRSVCINNTYSRLLDEVNREKLRRTLANSPKPDISNNSADDFFSSYNSHESLLDNQSNDLLHSTEQFTHHSQMYSMSQSTQHAHLMVDDALASLGTTSTTTAEITSAIATDHHSSTSCLRSSCMDTDLETLDRELNALNASMPITDPVLTQGAEQLEKAISRKRSRSEDDNDRLVREALSQFYLPAPRLLSGIDDLMAPDTKRCKLSASCNSMDSVSIGNSNGMLSGNDHLLDFDYDHNHNQSQKEFEVIMDALRLGGTTQSNVVGNSACNDSCGQAAMLSENGVFHNLVVASLET